MKIYFWIPVIILFAWFAISLYKKYRLLKNAETAPENEHITTLTDNTFRSTVNKGITLVDFWAPWCSPCKILAPIINEIAEEYKGRVKVCKLNVDQNGKTSKNMKIKGIPTIMIFKDGNVVGHFVGVKGKRTYTKALESLL